MRDKRIAHMIWRLSWQSQEAGHMEEYYVPLNVWREADILPPALRQALNGWKEGDGVNLDFDAGQYLPLYNPNKTQTFALKSFNGDSLLPRMGRFYPQALLPGFSGNMLPFRCTAIDSGEFRADFNHPLAGVPFTFEAVIHKLDSQRSDKGGECRDWLDLITNGPGMQARWHGTPTDFFADDSFARPDDRNDSLFYEKARLVSHVDAQARALIAALYSSLLKPGMEVLDLMSSWQSHLPETLSLKAMVGLGLNQEELRRNTRLTGHLLHDLNQEPRLPFANRAFDVVICNLSAEYMTRPLEVFEEVSRILKPGGLFIQTFSHRWFPPKVIRIWTELTEFERVGLVLEYFLQTGSFANFKTYSARGWPRPDTDRYFPQFHFSDPVFAVWAENKA